MIELDIPGMGKLHLQHAVFDVNGTLAIDGVLIEGVAEQLTALRAVLDVHLLTADTHGKQAAIDRQLGLTAERVTQGHEQVQKARFVEQLGAEHTVAIGNGANDVGMLKVASIGIAVLGHEGLFVEALHSADVIVPTAIDAFGLMLHPARLVATLRR